MKQRWLLVASLVLNVALTHSCPGWAASGDFTLTEEGQKEYDKAREKLDKARAFPCYLCELWDIWHTTVELAKQINNVPDKNIDCNVYPYCE